MTSGELPRAAPPAIRRRPAGAIDRLPSTLHPVLRRLYAARGIGDADELSLELRRLLPVSSLDGIVGATELLLAAPRPRLAHPGRRRLRRRWRNQHRAGAAPACGVSAMPTSTFRVPDRMRHGYGLTPALVADLAHERADLLITVDNGVAAFAGIEAARALGIEVLVTDHHLPGPTLPDCAAHVNPNLPGAAFGSRALAGVGVAFYLMASVTRALEGRGRNASAGSRGPARPGRTGYGRRRGAARPQQPDSRERGVAALSRTRGGAGPARARAGRGLAPRRVVGAPILAIRSRRA